MEFIDKEYTEEQASQMAVICGWFWGYGEFNSGREDGALDYGRFWRTPDDCTLHDMHRVNIPRRASFWVGRLLRVVDEVAFDKQVTLIMHSPFKSIHCFRNRDHVMMFTATHDQGDRLLSFVKIIKQMRKIK